MQHTLTMPHPTKKQRLEGHHPTSVLVAAENDLFTSFDDLSVEVLANIFKFLPLEEIMGSRRINKRVMEAVKMTSAPLGDFRVNSVNACNAMGVMVRAIPNLQQITLGKLLGDFEDELDESDSDEDDSDEDRHKWSDGEDPVECEAARTSKWISHDLGIISGFKKLRILELYRAPLNGRYPYLFNFPLLQKLSLNYCHHLEWDLEMLAGLPLLKELHCQSNERLTGNISSLRVLKDTLEKVEMRHCFRVKGNFMDMADFPHLKVLNLACSAVTGDIRDIRSNDFSSLEQCLFLPEGVYGGKRYEFQRISDVTELVRAVYLLNKQRPILLVDAWIGTLSYDSPDRYDSVDDHIPPPFDIFFVKAGPRFGYRWKNVESEYNSCEVNWLDPEPDRESSDYEEYIEISRRIERELEWSAFEGFHQPPTQEEYTRMYEEGRLGQLEE